MGIIVFVVTSISILYVVITVIKQSDFELFKKSYCKTIFDENVVPDIKKMLADNFVLYKMLNEKERKRFEKRVCRFIKMKDFRAGSTISEITDTMRVMVAASAIQITYGYPKVYFNHFHTIILFADEYYSTLTGQYHEGEVNAGGAIVLSWKNFMAGFNNLSDGRNLALHEMAHALRLTNIVDNDEYDFIDRDTMLSFENSALTEMQKIRRNESSFFRSYGAANPEEFFSVTVECFFEQPGEFREYNPELYSLLTRILKIDLLNFGTE